MEGFAVLRAAEHAGVPRDRSARHLESLRRPGTSGWDFAAGVAGCEQRARRAFRHAWTSRRALMTRTTRSPTRPARTTRTSSRRSPTACSPDAPAVRVHLADIEELNAAAARGEFELIKVSYGAIPTFDRSTTASCAPAARSAAAAARCSSRGPATARSLQRVSRQAHRDSRRAHDGVHASAARARRAPEGRADALRHDRPARWRAATSTPGLIIHESRFTYRDAGLDRHRGSRASGGRT